MALVQGFAAIDMETTGLSPRIDRVVEIAVIQLDRDVLPCSEFATLIKPGRDLGATHIHRITASDVVSAPRFEQVAPMLLDLLRGRVIVAHNVQFDVRFLHAEFAWIGIELPELPAMCAMQLAPQYLRGLPARSLGACCLAAGIQLDGAHAATVDARAVAQLLACYFRTGHQLPREWAQALADAAGIPRDELEMRAANDGLRVTSAVSRKTGLVVAADPDSESAKARRARELGVPLIAEPVFLAMLDRGISHHPAESRIGSL
jgi:DNA polymerase-3 subunit epsilon